MSTLHELMTLMETARNRPALVISLADELEVPTLPDLIREFLSQHLDNNATRQPVTFIGRIKVFHSASAIFVSPTDPHGIGCTRRELIRTTLSWYRGPARCNTVFVNTDDAHEGMQGMDIARVLCFFSLPCTNGLSYPCALIHWFDYVADEPDELTGMWMVKPSFLNRTRYLSVIHIDSIIRAAHLIPIFGRELVLPFVAFHSSLDNYRGFYINHFVDHHAFELCH